MKYLSLNNTSCEKFLTETLIILLTLITKGGHDVNLHADIWHLKNKGEVPNSNIN